MEGGKDVSTLIRPELSTNNKYWIDRHRYYELKHFCLQYNQWKDLYNSINGLYSKPLNSIFTNQKISNPTERFADIRMYYSDRMEMLQRVANETDPVLGSYILKAIIEDTSYARMNAQFNIPCCRDVYYELYRKFFYLLDKERK